jgi:uncharacterized protein (TIGR00159 family)
MPFVAIFSNLRLQDLLDVLFLSFVAYHLYIWFKGTKAFRALVGLLLLGLVYTVSRTWGLFLTTWVFQILWQVLVLLIIILFQSEIRQVLERVNPFKAMGFRKLASPDSWMEGLTKGLFHLASRRVGAIVVIERLEGVREWTTEGIPFEAPPSVEVLMSIFNRHSPLHDGAAIIRNGQISEVSCYLPLSPDEDLPKELGTRHRAALGLSQRSDALVLVVSEERGEVSIARGGELTRVESPERLRELLTSFLLTTSPAREGVFNRLGLLITRRWKAKAGSVLLVSLLWILLAGQQDFEVTLRVPLEVKYLPHTLEIVEPLNPHLRVTVRGLRKDASTLSPQNVHASVNLSTAQEGRFSFPIARENILLPNDRLQITNIQPSKIEFVLRKKGKTHPSPSPGSKKSSAGIAP